MNIFRTVVVEALDDDFQSYLSRREAQLSYRQQSPRGWEIVRGAIQDYPLDKFNIMSPDNRWIELGPDKSGMIIVEVYQAGSSRPAISCIDLADPGVNPVETIREHIHRFLNNWR